MGYEIRPFRVADAMAIKDDVIESVFNGVFGETAFVLAARMGPAYTATYDAQIIGVGGIIIRGLSCPRAWAMFTSRIPTLKIALDGAMEAKAIMDRMIKTNNLKRVYAGARCDFKKAQRYLHFLGFRPTGRILNEGFGASYEYVRTVE